MSRVVVGLFDEEANARRALEQLDTAGLDDHLKLWDPVSHHIATANQRGELRNVPEVAQHLEDMGVDQEDACCYAEGARRGGHIVSLYTEDDDAARAIQIMERNGALDLGLQVKTWRSEGWVGCLSEEDEMHRPSKPIPVPAPVSRETAQTQAAPIAREGETVLPVIEEELTIGKREVQRGGVRVYARVTEVPVQEDVTLREEKLNVERRPVDRKVTDADMAALKQKDFEVTETVEVPVVAKQARVVEEVVINKEVDERREKIEDKVRRTEVDVERTDARS